MGWIDRITYWQAVGCVALALLAVGAAGAAIASLWEWLTAPPPPPPIRPLRRAYAVWHLGGLHYLSADDPADGPTELDVPEAAEYVGDVRAASYPEALRRAEAAGLPLAGRAKPRPMGDLDGPA